MRERSKNMKEQKKNKGCVLAAESSYNAQNIQFSLVLLKKKEKKTSKENHYGRQKMFKRGVFVVFDVAFPKTFGYTSKQVAVL